jgi:hypothetical protein
MYQKIVFSFQGIDIDHFLHARVQFRAGNGGF